MSDGYGINFVNERAAITLESIGLSNPVLINERIIRLWHKKKTYSTIYTDYQIFHCKRLGGNAYMENDVHFINDSWRYVKRTVI